VATDQIVCREAEEASTAALLTIGTEKLRNPRVDAHRSDVAMGFRGEQRERVMEFDPFSGNGLGTLELYGSLASASSEWRHHWWSVASVRMTLSRFR
jgi:hypothetical protein